MDLHRTSGKPDWTHIPPARRNAWQHVAARTNGFITPGNVITIIGYVLVLVGLKAILENQLLYGGVLLAIGRLLDIADGWAADKTGTKSPRGELLDAAIDKVGTVLTIFIFFAAQVAPWWLLTALLVPQAAITYLTLRRAGTKRQIHPSRIGKNSMLTLWFTLIGFLLVGGLGNPLILQVPLYILSGIAISLGFRAAVGYARGKY